jgi:hypothetical protein
LHQALIKTAGQPRTLTTVATGTPETELTPVTKLIRQAEHYIAFFIK